MVDDDDDDEDGERNFNALMVPPVEGTVVAAGDEEKTSCDGEPSGALAVIAETMNSR